MHMHKFVVLKIGDTMKIILGSQSEGRKQMMEEMGYEFEVMAADIDEKAIRHTRPRELVLALANAKADALLPRIKEPALLITADQVVAWKDEIREKPGDETQAKGYLRTYHEAPAECVNGIAVTNTATGKRVSRVNVSKVFFRRIPEDVIDNVMEEFDVFSHAGGFSITSRLLNPYVEHIEGTIDSVIGLPKELTKQMIKEVAE